MAADLDTEDGRSTTSTTKDLQPYKTEKLGGLAWDAAFVDADFRTAVYIVEMTSTSWSSCCWGATSSSTGGRIEVTVEATPKKAFATDRRLAGLSRSGKTEELAVAALADYATRYAIVAKEAGCLCWAPKDYEVVERTGGGSGTDSASRPLDHEARRAGRSTQRRIKRQARLVEAACSTVFARVAAGALAELPQGPPPVAAATRQDVRPRRSNRGRATSPTERWKHGEAGRPEDRLPQAIEGHARCHARDPAQAVRRHATRRADRRPPVRRATDRLARPRPRLGDGGLVRSLPDLYGSIQPGRPG